MKLWDELVARGLIAQVTNEEEIRKMVNEGKATFYIGFDPTADSLHVGHFMALCLMKRLQMAGNKPVVLIGGGTAQIGDPSGRSDMRQMMTTETINYNVECFKKQMSRFIDFSEDKAIVVNNADWLMELNYVEVLREVGAHFSVNRMLSHECYKQRMERGLSFLEFNYMIMQSYDFYYLYQKYGCNMQFGGNDQWSNMLGGRELIRRKLEKYDSEAMTITLLLNSEGKKMGKTASGAVWLDPNKTSPYEFYQYWRNVEDADVLKCIRMLTFLPMEQIESMADWKDAQLNTAKEILAFELTKLVHGEEEAEKARAAAKALFGGGEGANVPTLTLAPEDFYMDGRCDVPTMLVKADNAEQADMVQEVFATFFTDYDVLVTDAALDEIKEKIVSGEAECAFVMTGPTAFTYYVENLSLYDMNTEIAVSVLQQIYQMNAMLETGMTEEQVVDVMSIQVDGQVENLGVNQADNFLYTYIMIVALYLVIMLYGQMVSTNVATEKSSRAMEVLITSAKPTSMMFGKVLASCLAGFIQLVAVFGSALIFYNLNKSYWGDNMIIDSIFNIPPELLVYMLVFFILGFLIYAFMFGAVGSTASKLEDINTSVMPITMLFIVAFIVVMTSMSSGNVDNTIMKVCSYIPFTSPMSMFTRIAMSTVPWYEIAISIAILVGSTVGIGVLSAKIYRVGVLMYGTTPKISNIIKAVWKA